MGGGNPDAGLHQAALHKASIQTIEENPGIPTQAIRKVFSHFLTQASSAIDIATPYFVPDADIVMTMKTAAARGVRVRLLVPRHSDPFHLARECRKPHLLRITSACNMRFAKSCTATSWY